jgi:hypothetical protein
MGITEFIDSLSLPQKAFVNERIAKKLLVENGAATPADKRAINEGIDELIWVAALKPNNIGVPAYRDDSREYLEIAILSMRCRAEARSNRITELIHRSIPYPVLLVSIVKMGQEENEISRKASTPSVPLLNVSVADKRFSQKDAQSMVLEDGVTEVQLEADGRLEAFAFAMNLGKQPRDSLLRLYHGWAAVLEAYRASRITGAFDQHSMNREERRSAIDDFERIEREISVLRNQAANEKQISRRVELNLAVKRMEARLDAVRNRLSPGGQQSSKSYE